MRGAAGHPGAVGGPGTPIEPFTAADFRVFALPGFAERMGGIRTRIRPKLESLGQALAAPLGRVAERESSTPTWPGTPGGP